MLESGKAPKTIAKERGLEQISDPEILGPWCDAAIEANAKSVEAYKSGKASAINALKGFVMKESRGKADPKKVDEILQQKLS